MKDVAHISFTAARVKTAMLVALWGFAATLWLVPTVSAIDSGLRCESSKLKTSRKYGACRLRSELRAVKIGAPPDFSKCDDKFTTKWASAESSAAGQCPTNGDEAVLQAFITQCTDDVAAALVKDSEQDRENSVREVVSSFYEAFSSNTFDTWVPEFTTEDWNHINPTGGSTRGQENVLAELLFVHSTFLSGVTDTVEDMWVRFATFNVAVVVATSRVSTFTTPDGVEHVNEQHRRTFVVVKRSGRWLVMQDQNTIVLGG